MTQETSPEDDHHSNVHQIFASYKKTWATYRNPGLAERLARATFTSYEELRRQEMVRLGNQLKDHLTPGSLVRFTSLDGTPLDVQIGRRKGEYSIEESIGLSLVCNGEEGIFIPSDRFYDIGKFRDIQMVKPNHSPRTAYHPPAQLSS